MPELWQKVADEMPATAIDVVPVIQRNIDVNRRYLGPVIHHAYQSNKHMHFVFANQSISKLSDGNCFIASPPASPPAPGFDHMRNELWFTQEFATYKGFRIPERTGCYWFAKVSHREGPMNATRPPVCAGRVLQVLNPTGGDLTGLAAGLMRSAALARYLSTTIGGAAPNKIVMTAYRASLGVEEAEYILASASRKSADECFFWMTCDVRPTWSSVESLVDDLIEAAGMLACSGESVRVIQDGKNNCSVSGRPVSILYAPSIDNALASRFSDTELLSGAILPRALVLLQVEAASRYPRAKTVGDVLRADQVSSTSSDLADVPLRAAASSVTIRLAAIHFCESQQLRSALQLKSLQEARNLLATLLPGVYDE